MKADVSASLPPDWRPEAVALRMKLIRTAEGKNQEWLGALVGVTGNQWGNYESNTSRVPALTAQRLDIKLGYTVQWIYNDNFQSLSGELQRKVSAARAKLGL